MCDHVCVCRIQMFERALPSCLLTPPPSEGRPSPPCPVCLGQFSSPSGLTHTPACPRSHLAPQGTTTPTHPSSGNVSLMTPDPVAAQRINELEEELNRLKQQLATIVLTQDTTGNGPSLCILCAWLIV